MSFNNIRVIFFLLITYSASFVDSSSTYDVSLLPRHYLTTKSIENNYAYTGDHWKLGNMTIYETRNRTFNRVLILAYDAQGMHNNSRQVADILAEAYGFRVVIPDFFRGSPWNDDNFPPENLQDLEDFFGEFANWNRTVKNDVLNIVEYFRKTTNCTQFGLFGFCWGGRAAVDATSDPETSGIIKAAGIIHPFLVTNDDAHGVNSPMYLLPSKDEINMLPFYEVLKQKFGTNSGHRRFDDMPHGFAAAGGNFSDPLNVQRVNEVIDILGTFFNRNLSL